VGCGGPSSVYLSTLSLGGDARIEYRPWEVESVLFVVTCGVISAVVVVVVAVADSAVFVVLPVAWWSVAAPPRSL